MRDADDRFSEVVVSLSAVGDDAGHHELHTGGLGPSTDRLIRLRFRSGWEATGWFDALLSSGWSRELSRGNETPKRYQVQARLLTTSLAVLGVAEEAPQPSTMVEPACHTWVPSRVGPGILENAATGRTMAFERIEFLGHDHHRGWIRAPRMIILSAIGGPRWPLELLSPPALQTPDPDDRGSAGSGLEFVTAAGLLRCRDARCEDQTLLSRLPNSSEDLKPPALSREEVRDLLELAAEASARTRRPSGAIDVGTYVKEFREIEHYEVLLDDARERTIGLRHRIRRARGGSTVRVRSERAPNGWFDPFESIVLAAEQGWVRNRTVAVRPDLAHHFATNESLLAWFVGITEDGIDDWQDVRDEFIEGVLGALEYLPEWEWGEWHVAEEARQADCEAAEEAFQLCEDYDEAQPAPWGVDVFPSTLSEFQREALRDRENEIAQDMEEEAAERWNAWEKAVTENPRAECPVSLSELADRLRGIA